MELEDRLVLNTPEGVTLDVVVAGLGSRGAACLVDTAIVMAALVAVTVVATLLSATAPGLARALVALAAFMAFFGYFTLFEAFGGGRTIGKRVVGLRVLTLGGHRAPFWRIAIRNVVRLIDFLPSGYLIGMISILATGRHQRLGDLVAGTMVVQQRQATPSEWLEQPAAPPPQLSLQMAGWDLSQVSPNDVAAVRQFLDRRASLPPQARATLAYEFAQRLAPLVQGPPTDRGPEQFLEWIVYAKHARG